jgi:protein-S-isoprenylcysteine O-methyltransferase Ste14
MIQVAIIFFIFAFIHSITVSMRFKRACHRLFGDTFMRVYYRALYTVISSVTFAVALYLIARVPDRELWTAPLLLKWALHGLRLAGLVLGVRAFEYLDTGEFMGTRQIWRYLAHHEVAGNSEGLTEKALVTTGVYGIVRHPLYLAGMTLVTFNPVVTVNGLTFTILADLYFLFGVFIEERRFLALFGDEYREYMKRVPRLMPRLSYRGGPSR